MVDHKTRSMPDVDPVKARKWAAETPVAAKLDDEELHRWYRDFTEFMVSAPWNFDKFKERLPGFAPEMYRLDAYEFWASATPTSIALGVFLDLLLDESSTTTRKKKRNLVPLFTILFTTTLPMSTTGSAER